jgi:hypothetical protein
MKIVEILKSALPHIDSCTNYVSEVITDLESGRYVKVESVSLAIAIAKSELSFTDRRDLYQLVIGAEDELLAA